MLFKYSINWTLFNEYILVADLSISSDLLNVDVIIKLSSILRGNINKQQ